MAHYGRRDEDYVDMCPLGKHPTSLVEKRNYIYNGGDIPYSLFISGCPSCLDNYSEADLEERIKNTKQTSIASQPDLSDLRKAHYRKNKPWKEKYTD